MRSALAFDLSVDACVCGACLHLNIRFPGEGYQLRLPVTSSGEQPEALPLPDPDAPAATTADVSAPYGRPVETSAHGDDDARGRKPEHVHD